MSLILSIGKWGGIYVHWKFTKRICLGWIAITFLPKDIDEVLNQINNHEDLEWPL